MEFDVNEMIRNMNAWTYEQLQPYLGKHVAWRNDGKAILAAADDLGDLIDGLDRQGVDRDAYTLDYIPEPDVIEPPTIPTPPEAAP